MKSQILKIIVSIFFSNISLFEFNKSYITSKELHNISSSSLSVNKFSKYGKHNDRDCTNSSFLVSFSL